MTVASHPPAEDLRCAAEPDAPALPPVGADAADWSAFDAAGLAFDRDALIAGRDCRAALARVCRWHVARGMEGDCAGL